MLKSVIISIAVLAVTGAPIHLRAATVSASIVDQTGDPNAVFVSPGDTFEIAVRLDTTESLISGEFRIQDLSQSGIFTLESVSFNDADWNLGVVLDPTVEPLTSVNGFTSGVFGSIADDLVGGIGVGSLDAAIIGVSVDPLAADGNYLLNLSDLVFGDLTFNPIPSVTTGQDYLVVVPEPATGLIAIIGLGFFVRRRSRHLAHRFSRHELSLCVACVSIALASAVQASDAPPQYFMDNNTVVTCGGIFYDSGGPKRPFFSGTYADLEDFVKTFIPTNTATEKLRFEFIMFDIEAAPAQAPLPFDRFEIYDGNSTNAPLIGVFFPRVGGGGSIPGTITSSAPDGSLTFRFVSDNLLHKDGWEANISCVPAYSVAFQNSGQSMWGPGAQAKPRDSDRVEFLTINHNDFRPDRNIVNLAGNQFGAGVFAGVTGDLGFQIRFDDIGPGSVAVRYPVDITLAGPTQDDFRAGDLVTIKTSVRLEDESGPYLSVASPDLTMKLDARANITANATAEACVFSCQSFNMFPSVNLGGNATIVELDASGNTVTVVTQQLPLVSTPFDIPLPIEALTGIGGNLDTPNMAIPPNPALTTIANGRSLVASGTDQFTTLSMDIDTWILRALQAPPALKLEIPEIPIFSLFGRFTIFGSFLIMDLKVDTDLHQEFAYSFTPTVHIAFEFPQPVQFTVRRNGAPIHSGTSTVIQLDAGDSVDLIAPDDVLNITPTFSLTNPTFTTDTFTRFVRSFREKLMRASVRVPSTRVACFPRIGICPACTPSFCLDFPGLNLNIGPLVDLDEPFAEFTDTRLFEFPRHQFPMQGFAPIAGVPFSVDPEFTPVARIDGPSAPFMEGSIIPFSAVRSTDRDNDSLVFTWDFGDGGTGQGPVSGQDVTHAYGDNGTYTVTLFADDGHGIAGVARFPVTVLNVDPEFTSNGGYTIQYVEGDFAFVPTAATDPGFLDQFVTSADYGEGAPEISLFSRFGPIPSIHYVYADEGVYTCNYCITDDDGGQRCDFVTIDVSNAPPTVTASSELTTQVSPVGDYLKADLRVAALFNDRGTLDTHTARVEWGDGTTDPLPLNEAPFGPPGFFRGADGQGFGEFTHIYNDVGTFGVKVCVLDNDGGEGCDDIGVVDVQLVDLFVTKNVSPAPGTPIAVGSELTYTLNVSNNGPGYAPDVRVTDVLPDGMELVSATRSSEGRIETKLVPADAACEDGHGLSVDVSDEYMLVSSPQKDQGLGAVYIYKSTGAVWTEHQKLTTTISSLFGAGFGSDVAIEGDTAAIGAPGENSGAGAVHVFQNSNGIWTDRAALVTTNGAPGDRFGFDVSLSGDTIAVGAEKAGANEIIIYEFDGTTWTPQDSISIGLDNGPGFEFALDVDTLAVIVRPTFSAPGTLTIYRRTNGTWNTEAVIVEATVTGLPTPNSFAHSVAIGGDVIVVGHRETIGDGIPSTASVFERSGSTWTQQTTLAANDGAENDAFGSSVDIDGDRIVVGARLRDSGKGAVYLFDRDGSNWSQTGRLTVSDGQFGDRLGESIAIDGATIVGGAPLADDFDSNGAPIFAGAAYVFATCPQSPRGTVTCGLGTIANGDSVEVVIVARAGCSLADDPFVSTTLVNNADALAHALEANLTDNHASVTSTTASPPQGVCGADFTPPIVSPVVSGTLGDNGWYTSDVVVTWVTSDPDSPISNLTGCDVTTVGFDTQGFTVTCVATSVGGVTSNGVTIKRDTTRPSISQVLVGTNGLNGWYTSDVQITFVCTDGVSDIASCEGATTLTDEGQNSCQFGTARDQAGNISTALVDGIMIDKTPPTITASRTAANANGWNNTDVAVTFECIDGTSGIGFCPPVATLTGEGAAQSVDGIATDLAGNPAAVTVNDINIDKTQPVIVANASPVANASGWQNSIVTVSFVCTDGLSGVQSCTPADVIDVEGSNLSTSGTVIDLAGNTASASEGGINIDWTPPTITASVSPPANANGANATPVTIGYLCSDDRSGVSACPTDVLLSDYGFGQSVASEVVDLAGNTTLLSVGGINIGVPVVSTTADLTVTEGEQIDMILATVTPYPATTGTASIEWGDQTIRDTAMATTSGLVADLSGAHVYADDGIYDVAICIGDLIGRPTCQTLAVTVVNLPPTFLSVESPTKPVEFGTAARLNALFNDLGTSDTHTATIDWGEGAGHEAVSVIEAPFGAPGDTLGQDGNIEADHFYAAPGSYSGEACVTDDEGESTCALFTVTVAPPSTPSCSITIGPATCTNGIASVGLEVTVTGHQGLPTAFVWDDDNPDGVYNSVDDNDFSDSTSQSPTLIAQAFTQFNVFCTVAFPDDSGLESIVCEAPITPCVSGEINSWSSVRSHGSAGEIGIPLDASKTANDLGSNGSNSEPRRGGIQKLLVTFDEVMVPANAALEPSDISVVDQTLVGHVPMAVSLDEGLRGTTLVIEFLDGALPDAALYTIDLAGALRSEVGGTLLSGDTDCVILSVVGDADQDGETSSIDIDLILTRQGEGVLSAPNARLDINADGVINLIDVAIAQARLGNGIQSGGSAPTALDFDLDGDLDIDDYAEFSSCITGPNNDPTVTLQPGCTEQTRTMADLDQDNDVDLRDFADFQLGFGE